MSRLIDEQAHEPGAVEQRAPASGMRAPTTRSASASPAAVPIASAITRAERRARDAEIEPQHQQRVTAMLIRLMTTCSASAIVGAREPDEPAEQHVVRERERRRPDAHIEIGLGRARHLRARAHQPVDDRARAAPAAAISASADRGRDQQRADQRRALLRDVAGAERLRGERDRAHAQEREQPEQAVEHHRRHRDRAEQVRLAEPPDHRRSPTTPSSGVVTLTASSAPRSRARARG